MRRALLGLLLLGCADSTRVDVLFYAEAPLAEAAARIHVRVLDTEGALALEVDEPLERFPVGVRLVPRGGDAGRRYTVIGQLLDAERVPIARVAYRGGYVDGAAEILALTFTAGCDAGLACDGATTCRGGVCRDACDDCDDPDGGAPPTDATVPPDAELPDAGPHTPAYAQRHVPAFSRGEGWASALGGSLELDASGGAWLVLASAALDGGEARLTVDGEEQARSASRAGGPWSAIALAAAGGRRRVDVELQGSASGEATLTDLRLVAFPIPGGAWTEAALPNRFVTQSEGWVSLAELRFTPSAAGRHLVLASVTATTMPATDAVGVRVDAGGTLWPMADGDPPHLAGATLDRQSFFLARAPTLSAGVEASFALQVRAGAPSSNASHAQVIALDLGAFAATAHDEALSSGRTSSATPETVASARTTAAARDWIAIGSVALLARGTRGAALGAGDLERRYTHALDADARLAYPFFAGLDGASPLDASIGVFASGAEVQHREATVHLLGL